MRVLITLSALCLSLGLSAQNTSPYWSLAGNANASTSSKLGTTNSMPLRLVTKNLERLRIDSNGRIGVGVTSIGARLAVLNSGSTPVSAWSGSVLPIFVGYAENTSGSADYIVSMASNTASARPVYIGKRSRGTLAAPTIVSNNDYLLTLRSSGYDGRAFQNNAAIEFMVDGTPAAGNVPARIAFATGSTGSNRTDRLVIGSTGNINFNNGQLFVQKSTGAIGIGTTNPALGNKLHVEGKSLFMNVPPDVELFGNSEDTEYGVKIKSISGGLYAESVPPYYDVSLGNYIGVKGRGATGVHGTGYTGVVGLGISSEHGVIGVHGIASYGGTGVRGESSEGKGVVGICVNGGGIGGYFASEGGIGVYATSGSADGGETPPYAGYFAGNVYSTGNYYPSDGKLKQNVASLSSALAVLAKLQPKEYEYKQEGAYKLMNLPQGKRYGLIAEELEKVLPGLVKKTSFNSSLAKKQDSTTAKGASANEKIDFKAVNYTELIPIVIKGMQEQQDKIQYQEQKIENLTNEVADLKALVNKLVNGGKGSSGLSSASLGVATPNPVNGAAIINYNIPQDGKNAYLLLTDMKGSAVKQVLLNSRGNGRITLNTAALAAGTYNYSLIVDGVKMDSKQLLIAR